MNTGTIIEGPRPGQDAHAQGRIPSPALDVAGALVRASLGLAVRYGAMRQSMSLARRLLGEDQ
jgi:hypothetical protein